MTTTDPRSFDAADTLATGRTAPPRPVPTPPQYGARARAARWATRRVLRRVPVTATLPDGTTYGRVGRGLPSLDVLDPAAFFARLGHSPMIGLGEGYMAREWQASPGVDLADALTPFAERLAHLIPPSFYRLRHLVMPRLLGSEENTHDGARENVHRHYDLSNDMFEQFLDPSLSYSSALFDTLDPAPQAADLEAAQLAKVDAALDAAGVGPGSRLLEIGTGWGTLAIRAAQRGAMVTTVTISAQQAELARGRVADAGVSDRVEVALRDYRDEQGRYDAVVSIEMIEAVGEKYWPSYFAKIDEVLAPGGTAVIQAILLEHHRMVATRNTYGWIHKYIFPGGLLPSTEAIEQVLAGHTTLRVSGVRRMGPHYAATLRLWREQFLESWPQVEDLGFDETFRRMWEYYLAYCESGFRAGYLDVAQLTIRR